VSTRTHSCEQAERLAQVARDGRDPVKRKPQEIEGQKAQKVSLRKEKNITVSEAAERWQTSRKLKMSQTSAIAGGAAGTLQARAVDQGMEFVRDVTVDAPDRH